MRKRQNKDCLRADKKETKEAVFQFKSGNKRQ